MKYFYSDGGIQKGPYTIEQLKNENISKDTLIWFEGLADWKPVKELKELEGFFHLSPPPIPTLETEQNSENDESKNKFEDSINEQRQKKSYAPRNSRMFSNATSFYGRIRRTEYGISIIIYFATALFLFFIEESGVESQFLLLVHIPMLLFLLAQGAKRCHDMGQSGWFQIIPLYPIWMLFAKGEEGASNKYGLSPKY